MSDAANLSQYDLTQKIAPFLDKHLLVQILEFLEENKIHSEKEILQAKLDVLSKTNMVDFAKEIYTRLHGTDAPKEMDERREKVLSELQRLQEEAQPMLTIVDDLELVKTLQESNSFNMTTLETKHNVKAENLTSLYHWAKFQYDIGNYSGSAQYLANFRDLSNDSELSTAALWGILGAQILMEEWEAAALSLNALREIIDSKSFAAPLQQLQQRTWLIHWSLFVFFNHPSGRTGIIEWFFNDRYLSAIQMACPHVLRFLAVAVITNKKKKNQLKELIRAIEQESYQYTDPITEFIEALYIQCDFGAAEAKLQLAEQVLERDVFLRSLKEEFVENARLYIFESYCKIHSCIDLNLLAQKLKLNESDAERWIVNLIRNARLDAKIDSQANQILLGAQVTSPYQQLIDKTKGLALRGVVLSNGLERAKNVQKKQKQQEEIPAK